MSELTERHEVRIRGKDQTIVFRADSADGRLVIRQEPDGKPSKDACAIALADPDELRLFFQGLRRILASLGYKVESGEPGGRAAPESRRALGERRDDDREAVVAQARQRNPQAFTPWTKEEEQDVRARYAAGDSVEAIARAHKRSPRAIELRLQRLGELRDR